MDLQQLGFLSRRDGRTGTDTTLAINQLAAMHQLMAERHIRTFVNPQNRAQVAVLMDVVELDVVMAAMQNQAMADAMEYDGVLPETLVLLVEEWIRRSHHDADNGNSTGTVWRRIGVARTEELSADGTRS